MRRVARVQREIGSVVLAVLVVAGTGCSFIRRASVSSPRGIDPAVGVPSG